VSIVDNGPGIPDEFHEKLYDKFTQSDSSDTRQVGGTGLGLNISKAIIESHNGTIDFITSATSGTTFFFDLPEIILAEQPDTKNDTGKSSTNSTAQAQQNDITTNRNRSIA